MVSGSAVLLLVPLLLAGCRSPADPDATGTQGAFLRLRFTQSAGGEPLRFDTAAYASAAGTPMSFEVLRYYLSSFRLFDGQGEGDAEGVTDFEADSVFFVDARDSRTAARLIAGVPPGRWPAFGFDFGLAPGRNRSGGLPNTLENLDMAWPGPMGGGYHFMQLEGRLFDSAAIGHGFYVHIGSLDMDGMRQDNHFSFRTGLDPQVARLSAGDTLEVTLDMDVSAWFAGARDYGVERLATGVMSDTAAQTVLRMNGEAGVFSVKDAILHAQVP